MKSICVRCNKRFKFGDDCFETDDGDLCPTCTAEMNADLDEEIRLQEEEEK